MADKVAVYPVHPVAKKCSNLWNQIGFDALSAWVHRRETKFPLFRTANTTDYGMPNGVVIYKASGAWDTYLPISLRVDQEDPFFPQILSSPIRSLPEAVVERESLLDLGWVLPNGDRNPQSWSGQEQGKYMEPAPPDAPTIYDPSGTTELPPWEANHIPSHEMWSTPSNERYGGDRLLLYESGLPPEAPTDPTNDNVSIAVVWGAHGSHSSNYINWTAQPAFEPDNPDRDIAWVEPMVDDPRLVVNYIKPSTSIKIFANGEVDATGAGSNQNFIWTEATAGAGVDKWQMSFTKKQLQVPMPNFGTAASKVGKALAVTYPYYSFNWLYDYATSLVVVGEKGFACEATLVKGVRTSVYSDKEAILGVTSYTTDNGGAREVDQAHARLESTTMELQAYPVSWFIKGTPKQWDDDFYLTEDGRLYSAYVTAPIDPYRYQDATLAFFIHKGLRDWGYISPAGYRYYDISYWEDRKYWVPWAYTLEGVPITRAGVKLVARNVKYFFRSAYNNDASNPAYNYLNRDAVFYQTNSGYWFHYQESEEDGEGPLHQQVPFTRGGYNHLGPVTGPTASSDGNELVEGVIHDSSWRNDHPTKTMDP